MTSLATYVSESDHYAAPTFALETHDLIFFSGCALLALIQLCIIASLFLVKAFVVAPMLLSGILIVYMYCWLYADCIMIMLSVSVSVSVSVYLLSLHILLFLWTLSPELKRMMYFLRVSFVTVQIRLGPSCARRCLQQLILLKYTIFIAWQRFRFVTVLAAVLCYPTKIKKLFL